MPSSQPDSHVMPNMKSLADRTCIGSFCQLIAHRYPIGELLPVGSPWIASPRVECVGETSAVTANGDKVTVSGDGVFLTRGEERVPFGVPALQRTGMPAPHPETEIRSVFGDQDGHVWLATTHGAFITDGADWWQPLNAEDGMPREDLNCIAVASNGDIWGGTEAGAWRFRAGTWRYFRGRRWLPGDRVCQILITNTGQVWLITDGGVSWIEERNLKLEDKASHYEEITALRHNRRGWVAGCRLRRPGALDRGFIHEASDNDGLWTGMYSAAEAFRYAVTGDEEARALSMGSMAALLDLVRLSGYPGFPARAIIQDSETVDGYDPGETVRVEGETDPIWYQSPGHPGVLAKGDTSSDELDGHYFAWFVYHELAATLEERVQLKAVVSAVTDRLIDGGYELTGHTGRRTRWAVYSPEELNGNPIWYRERSLNSTEILCYLRVAHHICGDERYLAAYEELIHQHHYLANAPGYRRGAHQFEVNHSDDELAYLVYYPLLMLETDSARRALLLETIGSTWQGIRSKRSPFFNAIYGATTGMSCAIEEAVDTLRDWPWELIDWDVRNSDRHDVVLQRDPFTGSSETQNVLPASERPLQRWNGNPFRPDGGSAGRHEDDGGAWLLAYWMCRYHQLITE